MSDTFTYRLIYIFTYKLELYYLMYIFKLNYYYKELDVSNLGDIIYNAA